ncbi:flavodoxin, partial [Oenococcus alcoholitolerans]
NEDLAAVIDDEFTEQGCHADVSEFEETDVADLKESDIVVIVVYTYDRGSLPEESLDFYEDLKNTDWSDKKVGVIGSGDVFYGPDYDKAVEKFAKRVKESGAKCPAEAVKINLQVDENDLPTIKNSLAISSKISDHLSSTIVAPSPAPFGLAN